jgi:hypothetical protein
MCMTIDNNVNLVLLYMSCNGIIDMGPYNQTLKSVVCVVMDR